MNLITVKTFEKSIDAHLLKSKLESEGITCYLFDEHLLHLYPLNNLAMGGIKLKINESDKEKAIAVLQTIENTPRLNESGEVIKCPYCESIDLYDNFKSFSGVKGILSAITAFALTLYPFYYKTVYKCKDCNTEFKA